MDVLVGLIVLAVFVGTWWWLAKQFRKSGRGFLVRHVLGCAGGWMASLLVAGIAVSSGIVKPKPPQPAERTQSLQPAPATSGTLSDISPEVLRDKQADRPDCRYLIIKEDFQSGLSHKVGVMLPCKLTDAEMASLAAKVEADFKGNSSTKIIGLRV